MCEVEDNNLTVIGMVQITTGGATTLSVGLGTNFAMTNFTASNNKGVLAGFCFTYSLD